jgi:hypothetical protein
MLEFETNVLAFMTAALEQTCRKLKEDTPEARKFVANKLVECAKGGRRSMAQLIEAGERALVVLDAGKSASTWWRKLIGNQVRKIDRRTET